MYTIDFPPVVNTVTHPANCIGIHHNRTMNANLWKLPFLSTCTMNCQSGFLLCAIVFKYIRALTSSPGEIV